MLQWITKFKHTIQEGKKITKRQEVILSQAVSYADVEESHAKFIEEEGFVNPTDPDISKHQSHEILGYDAENEKLWWKVRIKCVTEDDKGKISIYYVRYLVHADDMEKALKLVKEKEKTSPMPGEIEAINMTNISYMLVPTGEVIHS